MKANLATEQEQDRKLDAALGQVLRAGVALSVLITLAGATLLLTQHRGVAGRELIASQPRNVSLAAIFHAALHGDGAAIILAGLMVLLATPVFRVASMVVAFCRERDWAYAAISLAVLGLLVFGIVFAG